MTSITLLAVVVALVAAVRSTWSPCGVSMLSTITPLAEASRGRHYRMTATWFVTGAIGGGLGLGVLSALGAVLVAGTSPSRTVILVIAAAGALLAGGLDAGLAGPRLPHHRRQVNELWLDRYRGWVYGLGFGAQIGFGLATFIMTAGVYLTGVLGALTGRPAVALSIGVVFGLTRGLAVLAGAGLTSPDRLRRFHQRFEAWRRPVARIMILVECVVALVAAAMIGPAVVLVAAGLIVIAALSLRLRRAEPPAVPATRYSAAADPDWSGAVR